ncbi:2-oxoglutarate and Fe(II)-dependent oxygenase superfamily protein, partial [Prunus dulcis]
WIYKNPASLSLSRENGPPPSKACWNRRRVPYLSRLIPRPPTTCAGRKLRKNDGNSSKLTEISRPPISLLRPPFPSTQAVEVRRIHHRATLSFRTAKKRRRFWFGQNTGETLPNFR